MLQRFLTAQNEATIMSLKKMAVPMLINANQGLDFLRACLSADR
jgi:hypothetical protein